MAQVTDLLKKASELDLADKTELISSLLEDLSPVRQHVSDEEAIQRRDELLRGEVEVFAKHECFSRPNKFETPKISPSLHLPTLP